MNLDEVMLELKNYGNESTKKTLIKHGAKEKDKLVDPWLILGEEFDLD